MTISGYHYYTMGGFKPQSTEPFNLNFQSLAVVSRYRDTQFHVKMYVICEI